jgi:hypothetical protein
LRDAERKSRILSMNQTSMDQASINQPNMDQALATNRCPRCGARAADSL